MSPERTTFRIPQVTELTKDAARVQHDRVQAAVLSDSRNRSARRAQDAANHVRPFGR